MNNNRLWIIVGAVLIVAVIALGWFLAIGPRLAEAANADSERQTVEALNASHAATLADLQKRFDGIDALRDDLETLRGEIPAEPELEELLDYFDKSAMAIGVKIWSYTATEALAVDSLTGEQTVALAESGEAALAPSVIAAIPGFHTIPFTLTVAGSEQQVIDFVDLVQSNTRLTLVTDMSFGTKMVNDAPGGMLSGFVYVIQEPGAAGERNAEPAQ